MRPETSGGFGELRRPLETSGYLPHQTRDFGPVGKGRGGRELLKESSPHLASPPLPLPFLIQNAPPGEVWGSMREGLGNEGGEGGNGKVVVVVEEAGFVGGFKMRPGNSRGFRGAGTQDP